MTHTTDRAQIEEKRKLIAEALREVGYYSPHGVEAVQDKLAPLPGPEYPTVKVKAWGGTYMYRRRRDGVWEFSRHDCTLTKGSGWAPASLNDDSVRALSSLLPENTERRYTAGEIIFSSDKGGER